MEQFCQSCTMPLTEEVLGTNADGSKNGEYCTHCYQKGEFVNPDITMEQMIDFCANMMADSDETLNKEELLSSMNEYFPQLKRWKK